MNVVQKICLRCRKEFTPIPGLHANKIGLCSKACKKRDKKLNRLRARQKKNLARKLSRTEFYESREWLSIRYDALKTYGRICMLCKTVDGQMHVDHIKPRSKYPELELEFSNLQILCRACNLGKSNTDDTDFREEAKERMTKTKTILRRNSPPLDLPNF